eukprot:s3369_g6.t1
MTQGRDEQRVLRQAPSGSILLSAEKQGPRADNSSVWGNDRRLGMHFEVDQGWLLPSPPKAWPHKDPDSSGVSRADGCGAGSGDYCGARDEEGGRAEARAEGLQQKLDAIRMMEVKQEDWRQNLAAYAQEGCVVDGLQVLFRSPIFKDLPDSVTATMVPNMEVNDQKGWEYFKQLPLCRRFRKRLMRSKAWVLNLYGRRMNPIQALNGQINPSTNSEVVVVNVDVLLNGGWSMMGPAYKALLWGALSSRVKAVLLEKAREQPR